MCEAVVTVPMLVTVKLNAEHDGITKDQMREAILKDIAGVAAGVTKSIGLSSSASQAEVGWVDENTSFCVTDILEVDMIPVMSTSEGPGDIVFYT